MGDCQSVGGAAFTGTIITKSVRKRDVLPKPT